ncbi:solute carrier family 23 member 1-like isoform X2 [Argopecten irradians]|uniref:solute carrier family 23 member 1-like isoform X2 n=1 Tax=Argopecten irradians TaxID=31199 RepID=UPI00371178EF
MYTLRSSEKQMPENLRTSLQMDIDDHPSRPNGDTEARMVPESDAEVEIEYEVRPRLLYNVSDRVPIHFAIFCAFQQTLIALSSSLAVSTFVADITCASDFPDIRRDLLSTTLLMNGITTLLMVTIGARLPLFQGAASEYVVPLLAMQMANPDMCKLPVGTDQLANHTMISNDSFQLNTTSPQLIDMKRAIALTKLTELQGCLMLVGAIHCLVGLTGLGGLLLRFIGPVTIVPAILLMGTYLSRATAKFARCHWGITAVTAVTALIMSLHLSKRKMPCLAWSRKKGFYIFWYPFHQVFSILIGLMVGWGLSAILTYTQVLSNDPSLPEYMARSDARADIITNANWFKVPYPNQFGTPRFNMGVFIAFFIGTLNSILDSIGDYYSCARTCNVPPPPRYAVNRAIAVEGLGSALSGLLGCGHATTTYGANIGVIGLTKVASRQVLLWTALIYIMFGIVGKVSALFITIPIPVLGGAMIVMFGMFNGIALSNLQVISLSSTRNLAIIGTSLLTGLMVPHWLEAYPDDLQTGSTYKDSILKTLLSNPILCGGTLAAFLDNTVPGTANERGITAWQHPEESGQSRTYSEGLEMYAPIFPSRWLSWRLIKYLPFCQYEAQKKYNS